VADQPSWGKVVHRLGAGPEPIPFAELERRRLVAAIDEAAGNPKVAGELGTRIRAEDGLGQAVGHIYRHLGVV
jgi:sterol 3beta-glucosyltransferase